MKSLTKLMVSVAAIFAIATLTAVAADVVKPIDEGKGSAFKSKSYEVKQKGEIAVVLSFEAGKEVTVTTGGAKDANVHLLVKGMYFEAKDSSPGPVCLVKFTPVQGDDNFTFTIRNNGSRASKVTLKVKVDD